MSNAVTSTGILIKRSPGPGTTAYVTIAEITQITPGGMSRNKIETSTHNDGTESHVLGIMRQDDPGLSINFLGGEASHLALLADIQNNAKNSFLILFPSGKSRAGDAFVQQFKFDDAPVDGKQGAKLAFTWAGPVVEA